MNPSNAPLSPACINCRFVHVTQVQVWACTEVDRARTKPRSIYVCRRYPPSANAWPEVAADAWCGEYEPERRRVNLSTNAV